LGNSKEAQETFQRFADHLAENKVDLEAAKVQFGPRLKIDPQSETFPGNAEANQMLTREYRAPYIVPAAGKV
jgi:hypothetical protein